MEYIKEHKNQIIIWSISYILVFVFGLFLGAIISCLKNNVDVNIHNIFNSFSSSTGIVFGIGFLLICILIGWNIYYYSSIYKKSKKASIKRSSQNSYGSSRFLIDERKNTDKNELREFNSIYPFNENKIGWVVKSNYNEIKNKTDYNVSNLEKDGHHLLVIGATSTGKTQKTILQSIAYNAQLNNNQPSMVIFDPKGEIAAKTGNLLKSNNYDVLVFNLRDTNYSATWNPLYIANQYYFEAKVLEQKLKNHTDYDDLTKINLESKIQNLLTSVDSAILDIGFTLYNDPNAKDKFWPEQAKAVFISLYYLLVESIYDKYINNKSDEEIQKNMEQIELAKENVNLPTIASMSANIAPIKEMFERIDKLSNNDIVGISNIPKSEFVLRKSYLYGSNPFKSSENTFGSIVVSVANGLSQYKLASIQNITLTNEIKLDKLTDGDKPKALFIIAPDEREETYKFATLLVDQIYKTQIEVASKNEGQCLKRKLMFFLDEFGNIPTIPKFDTMVTVSRSRGIFFCIAIQGFDQIKNKYGENQLSTIRDNMRLHIYVKTSDKPTNEYYSYRSGNYTIEKSSISNNDNGSSSSTNIEKKELLTAEDVFNNPNNMLLVYFDANPVSWVKTTSFWQSKELSKYIVNEFNSLYPQRIFKINDHTIIFDTTQYQKYKNTEINKFNSRPTSKFSRKHYSSEQLLKIFKITKATNGLDYIIPSLTTLVNDINRYNIDKSIKNNLSQSITNLIENYGIESVEVLKEILELVSKNKQIDLTVYERNIVEHENKN